MFNIKIKISAFFLSFIILLLGNVVLIAGIVSDKTPEGNKRVIGEKALLQVSAYSQKIPESDGLSDETSDTVASSSENGFDINNAEPEEGDDVNQNFYSDDFSDKDDETYPAGFYVIGEDMPSGIYKLSANESQVAFYRISNNKKEDYYSITDNDVFNTFTYILVNEGEYLNLVDASAVSLEKSISTAVTDLKDSTGKYLVGKDIAAATYNVIPNGKSGYIEIAVSPIKSLSDILFSRIIKEQIQITLLDGQYIKLSSAYIELIN